MEWASKWTKKSYRQAQINKSPLYLSNWNFSKLSGSSSISEPGLAQQRSAYLVLRRYCQRKDLRKQIAQMRPPQCPLYSTSATNIWLFWNLPLIWLWPELHLSHLVVFVHGQLANIKVWSQSIYYPVNAILIKPFPCPSLFLVERLTLFYYSVKINLYQIQFLSYHSIRMFILLYHWDQYLSMWEETVLSVHQAVIVLKFNVTKEAVNDN